MTLNEIDAITLDCKYEMKYPNYQKQYTCVAENLRTEHNNRDVVSIGGLHKEGMSISNVNKLDIYKQSCPFLPKNLGTHFKNLEYLKVTNTNLKFLIDGDLDSLTMLKSFDVSWNPIEELGRNFFNGQTKIEFVSFFFCHLKVIDSGALLPLVSLESANFLDNICISFHITEKYEIIEFGTEARDKCKKEYYEGKMFNRIEIDENPIESLPFLRKNVTLVTICIAIPSVLLLIVLLRLFCVRFGSNWVELREALI